MKANSLIPPKDFLDCIGQLVGADRLPAFINSLNLPPTFGLRVNPIRFNTALSYLDNVQLFLSRLSDLGLVQLFDSPLCYLLPEKNTVSGKHPYHLGGAFYLQEPSAMSVFLACQKYVIPFINSSPRVIDLCAAPGGKATAIASLLHNNGVIVANEPVFSRAAELKHNMERMGITNSVVISEMPDKIAGSIPDSFDLVLCDAPCSGEGMFRKNPSAITEWSKEHVASCAVRQKAILDSASLCVKENGFLCYSTCTFNQIENEDVINHFLSQHKNFSVIVAQRKFPDTDIGEGHFLCILQRDSGNVMKRSEKSNVNKQLIRYNSKLISDFLSATLSESPKQDIWTDKKTGMCFFASSQQTEIASLFRCLSFGVPIGIEKNNYFDASHSLFMSDYSFSNRLSFSVGNPFLDSFLKGEELSADSVGFENDSSCFVQICCDDYPLGFTKYSPKCYALKNKLPKGIRL